MTERKYYQTIGLPLSAWKLLEEVKRHPVFREVHPVGGSDSDALLFLMRHGTIRLTRDFSAPEEVLQ